MRCFLAFALFVAGASVGADEAPDFYAHWGDGRAEISSYKVMQPRYGEMRQGYGVLIFVTEDIHRKTLIKVERPSTPKAERIYALKLNNVLKFTTGIYDYSVMTSVFSAVEGEAGRPFEMRKVTLSAQEWCGHVFDEVQVRGEQLAGFINSYFEGEGRQPYELERPQAFESEDHLLIRIRELRGAFLEQGTSTEVALLPSLWSIRVRHRPHALVQVVLHKGRVETIAVNGRSFAAIPWKWEAGDWWKTVWVEAAYPRRILLWEDSTGGRGEWIETVREPYWQLHGNGDVVLRQRLGIP